MHPWSIQWTTRSFLFFIHVWLLHLLVVIKQARSLEKWYCQTAIIYFVLIFYHCLSYNLNKNQMYVISSFNKNLSCALNLRWKSLLFFSSYMWISVYVTFLCQTVIKFLQCRSSLSRSTFLIQTTNQNCGYKRSKRPRYLLWTLNSDIDFHDWCKSNQPEANFNWLLPSLISS